MQFIFSKRNKNGCKDTAFLSYMQEKSQKTTKNLHISQFFSTFARPFGKKYDKTMFTPINAHIEIDRVLKRVRNDGKEVRLLNHLASQL